MASSQEGRPSIAQVNAQQVDLQGRVTGLERDMQNMSHAVSQLSETVSQGFRDTREMLAESSKRQDQRTTEIHQRLDKQAERERWNPGLLLAGITCAILIGGIFVSFVVMTTQPLARDDVEIRTELTKHEAAGGHTDCLTMHAQEQEMLLRQREDITETKNRLELANAWIVQHSDMTGYTRAQIESLQRLLDAKTADRFLGREGQAFEARLRAIEEYIRDKPGG